VSHHFDLLADRLAELVTERVAELLDERAAPPPPLLDATQTARYLGVERSAVYAMAKDGRLPAIKLGGSDRPRLRFDPRALTEHLGSEPPKHPRSNGRRRSRSLPSDSLLPIRGVESK
jgi:excisionase family DNA binding protein